MNPPPYNWGIQFLLQLTGELHSIIEVVGHQRDTYEVRVHCQSHYLPEESLVVPVLEALVPDSFRSNPGEEDHLGLVAGSLQISRDAPQPQAGYIFVG